MALTIKRATVSTKMCCHPSCSQKTDLIVVPLRERRAVLKEERYYLPKLVKACPVHLNHEAWASVCDESEYMFTVDQIEDMVDMLRLDPKPGQDTLRGNNNTFC